MTAAPVLGTAPQVLRPWRATPGDAAALAAGWADPVVQRHLDVPADRSIELARRWMAAADRRRTSVDLAVEIRGVVVGEVGASQIDRVRGTALVGWWLLPDARGHGVATWAVDTFSGWLLGSFGLARIAAIIGPTNGASVAVAQRCGFRFGVTTPDGSSVYERLADSATVRSRP